jgi:hypothetical protein
VAEAVRAVTDDIVAFIRARLDEDRAAADEMQENANWMSDCGEPHNVSINLRSGWEMDSARVLRGVEIKRRIVGEHGELGIEGYCAKCGTHDTNGEGDLLYEHDEYPCRTLRLLALEWSTHDDFRPEWTP